MLGLDLDDAAGQKLVPGEIEMNMLVKELAPGEVLIARLIEDRLRIVEVDVCFRLLA